MSLSRSFHGVEFSTANVRADSDTHPLSLPAWARSLDDVLALAQKTPGWNNRTCPPQRARLAGGCVAYILPPILWRRRCGHKTDTLRFWDNTPIPFPRRRVSETRCERNANASQAFDERPMIVR